MMEIDRMIAKIDAKFSRQKSALASFGASYRPLHEIQRLQVQKSSFIIPHLLNGIYLIYIRFS